MSSEHSISDFSKVEDAPPGSFPVTVQNNTGKVAADQVWVMVLAQTPAGQFHYLKADGSFPHINHLDANAPDHLTKNGVNYPNMTFNLTQMATFTLPGPLLISSRIYISLGSPLFFTVTENDSGYGGADLNNPTNPNIGIYFDFYEFSYQYPAAPFNINTTSVDMWGLPLAYRLQQSSSNFDQTRGITKYGRQQIYPLYSAFVGPAFKSLVVNSYQIYAPRYSPEWYTTGPYAKYFQPYIDSVWNQWTGSNGAFKLDVPGGPTYEGSGDQDGNLVFKVNGTPGGKIAKPNTTDVVQGSGPLATGNDAEKALGAQICAAFNRGVAEDTSKWYDVQSYYPVTNPPHKNDYAEFWHTVGLDNLAYGFSYDDVNHQDTNVTLPNGDPPSLLTLIVGF